MSLTLPGRVLVPRLGDVEAFVGAACDFILGAAPTAATKRRSDSDGSAASLFLPVQPQDSSLRLERSDADEAPMKHLPRILTALTLFLIAAVAAAPAFGSAIIGRDVTRPTLSIDRQGR